MIGAILTGCIRFTSISFVTSESDDVTVLFKLILYYFVPVGVLIRSFVVHYFAIVILLLLFVMKSTVFVIVWFALVLSMEAPQKVRPFSRFYCMSYAVNA